MGDSFSLRSSTSGTQVGSLGSHGPSEIEKPQVGVMNDDQVRVGQAPGRATSALKTAWMEVKHFFTSLFGSRVSTHDPDQITNKKEAAQSVIHAMTKSSPHPIMVLLTLAKLNEHGNFTQDAQRQAMTQEAGDLFGQELQGMSDMQLFRLYKNFERHPEYLETFAQLGTIAIMEYSEDDPPLSAMQGAGKVGDAGSLAFVLYTKTKEMLEERGYALTDVDGTTAAPSREMELFAKYAMDNGGNLTGAVRDTYQHLQAEARGEQVGPRRGGQDDGSVHHGSSVVVEEHSAEDDGPTPLQQARDQALGDPRIDQIFDRGSTKMGTFIDFMKDNFEAVSSDAFWTHPKARQNVDNFGGPLAIASLELFAGKQGGDITEQDLARLDRALNPHDGPHSAARLDVPDTVLGPYSDDKLSNMCDLVYDQYFGDGAPYKINMEGWSHEETVREVFQSGTATGAEKLQALREALVATGAGQYMPIDNLADPLRAIR